MTRLRLLVLAVSDRCDQRCLHCGIWRGGESRGLGLAERLAVADEAVAQKVEAAYGVALVPEPVFIGF